MSKPPSFEEDTTIIVKKPNSNLAELPDQIKVYRYHDIKPRCDVCDKEFENNAGLTSHIVNSNEHHDRIKDMKKGLYKSDIITLRLPKEGEWIYDSDLPGYVSTATYNLPEDYVLLDIIGQQSYKDPKGSNAKLQYLEVRAIKKDKVIS